MPAIILATLNARYAHASLGLRYLYANLGELRSECALMEFTTVDRPLDVVERILNQAPRIVGFGVYIWNVAETTTIVRMLKAVAPDVRVVLGGPEVSHETEQQQITATADHVITGPGDLAFAELCRDLLAGRPVPGGIIRAAPPDPAAVELPYRYYDADDIAHRMLYVEASRGCPYRCEFCLSSLDERVWPFELTRFLGEMEALLERGARHFRFVDRTFNLKIEDATRILEFFLARIDERLFLHFELVPDRLPERLRHCIQRFPAGSLQFEVGVQTFTPAVQQRISRRQDAERTEDNLRWLRAHSSAHIHADLIVGLPGETLSEFAAGFDRLIALRPHEIQVGILKRLRGTPIARHAASFDMRFSPDPPYSLLHSREIGFLDMQRMNRFARYWDLIANSGRFAESIVLLLGDQPFHRFLSFSDWLWSHAGRTHQIPLERLFDWVFRGLTECLGVDRERAIAALVEDFAVSGLKGGPDYLRQGGLHRPRKSAPASGAANATRQFRHLRS